MDEKLVEVGYVARAHGVRGELRAVSHDPESPTLGDVTELHIGGRRYGVVKSRAIHGAFLLTLEGIGDRNAAEELRGKVISVPRDALDLEEGELLLADLVGCAVTTTSGAELGEVIAIDVGPQNRLVVADGDIERLIPIVDEIVIDVDPDARTVVVEPPEGLPTAPLRRRK